MSVGLLWFAAQHYVFLALLAACALALGGWLTRRVEFACPLERYTFATAAGLGALGTLTFLVGLAHLLYAPVLLLALLAALWLGREELLAAAAAAVGAIGRASWLARGLTVALAGAGSRILLLPLYPPTQWDSISYHIAVADIYARQHAVVFTPYLRTPVFPQLNELLFTLAITLYDDLAAQCIQMLFLLLTGVLLMAWAQRTGASLRAGLWASALWISSPLVMMIGSSGYIEMSLACFLTAGAYAFTVWLRTRQRGWLLLAAAMFGFAEGVKYLALFPIAIAGLTLLYFAARQRSLRDVLAFTAMLLAVAGPWHGRIAWHMGNPVWPYAAKILGSGSWPLEDITRMQADQFNAGAGRSLQALAQLPYNLTFELEKYFTGELPLTPLLLFLLPLTLIMAGYKRHILPLLGMVALYTLFWFYTAQNARYLIHALPLLCLAVGMALAELAGLWPWRQNSALDSTPTLTSTLVTALICLALAVPGYSLARLHSANSWIAMPDELPPVSAVERDTYIAARVAEYAGVNYLNQTHAAPYTLYSFPNSNLNAYVHGSFVGDWYGPASYVKFYERWKQPESLHQFLREHGVDYVHFSQVAGMGSGLSDEALLAERLPGHLKLIYARESIIFEVSDELVRPVDTPELLRNPQLEEPLVNGAPPGWTLHGAPLVDASGKEGWNSRTAVSATGGDWIEQSVPVEPGALYIFRVLARPTHETQYGQYQVDWLDAGGKLIHTSSRLLSGPVDWAARAYALEAPAGATRAVVHAAATDGLPMWFDWFSFKKLSYK